MFNQKRVKRVIDLENTVLLYRGTQKMYELLQREEGDSEPEEKCLQMVRELLQREKGDFETEKEYLQKMRNPQTLREPQVLERDFIRFTTKLYYDAFIDPEKQDDSDNLRHQNTLLDFFRFLKSSTDTKDESSKAKEIIIRAARLLCLYDCVMQIKKDLPLEETNIFIPYLFERICNCMRDIAESDMCYLAHYRDDNFTMIATSSYEKGLKDYILDESSFFQVDNNWKHDDKGKIAPVGGTVFRTAIYKKSTIEEKYRCYPVLALRLVHPWTQKKEPFYLLFQKNDDKSKREWDTWENREEPECDDLNDEDLSHMRDILFLRSELVNRIHESLHIQMLSQKTCRYVIPVGEEPEEQKKTDEVIILHLTDLHFTTNDREIYSKLINNFPEREPSTGRQYDLVVITGDVVQGRTSAGVLEENYLFADKLLRDLAWRLWGYKDDQKNKEYLRSDWKKRIIIIPGNHDYASMNELEVIPQSGLRSTGTGRPSQTEGGPMVKFAYYIHFINVLLGINVGEQVREWLNSTRYYNRMNLSFLCLNTSAGSGPLRNNKVSIYRDFIEKNKNTGRFKDRTTVCLAHHSPQYNPDYFFDRYYVYGVDWDKIKTCVDEFRNILSLDVKNDSNQIAEALMSLNSKMLDAKISSDKPIMEDFTYYRMNYRNTENERCEAIRSAMKRDVNMGKEDKEKQKKAFNEINEYANVAITLSGHVHVAEAYEDEHCYVGARLFDREKGAEEFSVLRLYNSNGKIFEQYDWLHYRWKLPSVIVGDEKIKTEKSVTSAEQDENDEKLQLVEETSHKNMSIHPTK